MKQLIFCVPFFWGVSQVALCQNPIFKIQYDVSEKVSYHKYPEDNLSRVDSIAYMPEISGNHHSETFYSNGTIQSEVDLIHPKSYLENWLDSLDHMVVNDSMSTVKTNTAQYDFTNNSYEISNIREIVPYYLGTNYWQLPLDNQLVHELQIGGFELIENSKEKLVYQNESWRHTYNKPLALECLEHLNSEGVTDHRIQTYYTPNEEFPLLDVQLKQEWFPTTMGSSCAWICISSTYYNIVRTYWEPVFQESNEDYQNIGYSATVCQIPSSDVIQIDLPEFINEPITAEIRDSYGLPVLIDVELNPNQNHIVLTNVPTGIYTLYFNHNQLLPSKFLYTP